MRLSVSDERDRRICPRTHLPPGQEPSCIVDGHAGTITVLSERGMFIRTDYQCPIGAVLEVVIHEGDPFRVRCVQRSSEPVGIGVEFFEIFEVALNRVRNIISRFSGRD